MPPPETPLAGDEGGLALLSAGITTPCEPASPAVRMGCPLGNSEAKASADAVPHQAPARWTGGCRTLGESRRDLTLAAPPGAPDVTFQADDSYLVDSASSHMLVSKIKPCMSKYKQTQSETANGSLYKLSFI